MGEMAGLSDSNPWDSDSKEKGQLTNQPQNGRVWKYLQTLPTHRSKSKQSSATQARGQCQSVRRMSLQSVITLYDFCIFLFTAHAIFVL